MAGFQRDEENILKSLEDNIQVVADDCSARSPKYGGILSLDISVYCMPYVYVTRGTVI